MSHAFVCCIRDEHRPDVIGAAFDEETVATLDVAAKKVERSVRQSLVCHIDGQAFYALAGVIFLRVCPCVLYDKFIPSLLALIFPSKNGF